MSGALIFVLALVVVALVHSPTMNRSKDCYTSVRQAHRSHALLPPTHLGHLEQCSVAQKRWLAIPSGG